MAREGLRLSLLRRGRAHEGLDTLAGLISRGEIKLPIDKVHSFDEIPEAMAYIGVGHTKGKIVVDV